MNNYTAAKMVERDQGKGRRLQGQKTGDTHAHSHSCAQYQPWTAVSFLTCSGRTSLLVVFMVILWHNGGFPIRVDWLIPA